jgi:hypothetical protein
MGTVCLQKLYAECPIIADDYGNDMKFAWFIIGGICMVIAGIFIGGEK